MNTLIIPVCGLSTRFPNVKPKYLLTHPDGKLMIEKSMENFDVNYDRLIITILKEHDDRYESKRILKSIFPDAEILVMNERTKSQADTVAKTLSIMGVDGPFISRDCDSYVNIKIEKFENLLVGIDLRKYLDVTDVAKKSFIKLNDRNVVMDIIEKDVSSNYICVGVYGFDNSSSFLQAFKKLERTCDDIYISHIASYLMANDEYFNYLEANHYIDYGKIDSWSNVRKSHTTYFVDIDGVVFKNRGRWGEENWGTEPVPLKNNIEILNKLHDMGSQIIFCTSRDEYFREKTESDLSYFGLSWHDLIMNCNHTQRVIINDYSSTNPYRSCDAINVPRDADNLKDYIQI